MRRTMAAAPSPVGDAQKLDGDGDLQTPETLHGTGEIGYPRNG